MQKKPALNHLKQRKSNKSQKQDALLLSLPCTSRSCFGLYFFENSCSKALREKLDQSNNGQLFFFFGE
jgi:hypothetical protein